MLSWTVDAGAAAVVVGVFWLRHLSSVGEWVVVVALALAAVVAAALLLRWRFPVVAPIVALAATGAGWVLGVSDDPMLGVAWCLYPLALQRGVQTRPIGLAALVVMVLVSTVHGSPATTGFDQRIVLACIAIAVSWLLGHVEARRLETVRLTVRQQAEAEQARQQAAMSRDVHDVVGHALSVIRAEADVARNLPGLQEAELRQSLADIEQRARGALEEVQSLVRALRTGQPTAETGTTLPQLVAAARASGLEVAAHIDLPDTSPETGLVVSRVVQEALSNVVRHAGARRCEVSVWPEADVLAVRVDDDGTGLIAGDRTGTGLVGMRERVEGAGGSLTVTSRLEGGTRILAKVPLAVAP